MKDTDKVTMTVAQLKKLVNEAKVKSQREIEDPEGWEIDSKAAKQIISILGSSLERANSTLTKLERAGKISKDGVLDVDKVLGKINELIDKLESKY